MTILYNQHYQPTPETQMINNVGIQWGNSVDDFKQNLQTYFNTQVGGHAVTIVGWDEWSSRIVRNIIILALSEIHGVVHGMKKVISESHSVIPTRRY